MRRGTEAYIDDNPWLADDAHASGPTNTVRSANPVWRAFSAAAAAKGKPVPVIDGLLAATALQHDLMLVTRNTADLARTGVSTINPWL
jgi:hypothetical protein